MNDSRFRIYIIVAVAAAFVMAGWGLAEFKEENHRSQRNERRLDGVVTTLKEQIRTEGIDRQTQAWKNVEARRSDCEGLDRLRESLRAGLEQGERTLPLFLSLLPQFNDPRILTLIKQEDARERRAYESINCKEYALAALPVKERAEAIELIWGEKVHHSN